MKTLTVKAITAGAALTVLIDWWLKAFAIERLPEIGSRGRLVDFILHKNEGIAFNIPIPLWIIIPLTVGVCTWLAFLSYQHWNTDRRISVSANVVLLGAIGNLADRVINNFTTDYILLFGRSAINLADILIVTGILSLLWYTKHTRTS